MKIIFAGTPPFAAAALDALHAAGHELALVLTQPDRPAGRGLKLTPSAVSELAARLRLPVAKFASLKTAGALHTLSAVNADVMVVAAYGLLLPPAVLALPRVGCINIHGSLLPRWRGAAPVQRAIEAGDAETGITIMQMDEGLDTGAVLLGKKIAITNDDTSATLFEKLTALGAAAMVDALEKLPTLTPRMQAADGVTYAKKIDKTEAAINWHEPAENIARRIRAFDPFPGCETMLENEKLKIWRAFPVNNALNAAPGNVFAISPDGITIACGVDALRVTCVQRPGGKRLSVADWLRGQTTPLQPGSPCQ